MPNHRRKVRGEPGQNKSESESESEVDIEEVLKNESKMRKG
jgi:hypothetical protein